MLVEVQVELQYSHSQDFRMGLKQAKCEPLHVTSHSAWVVPNKGSDCENSLQLRQSLEEFDGRGLFAALPQLGNMFYSGFGLGMVLVPEGNWNTIGKRRAGSVEGIIGREHI